jgi:hypothetical protein
VILDCLSYTHLVYRPGFTPVGAMVITGRVEVSEQLGARVPRQVTLEVRPDRVDEGFRTS